MGEDKALRFIAEAVALMGMAGALRAAGGCLGHIFGRLKARTSAPLRIGEGAHVTLEVVWARTSRRIPWHRARTLPQLPRSVILFDRAAAMRQGPHPIRSLMAP